MRVYKTSCPNCDHLFVASKVGQKYCSKVCLDIGRSGINELGMSNKDAFGKRRRCIDAYLSGVEVEDMVGRFGGDFYKDTIRDLTPEQRTSARDARRWVIDPASIGAGAGGNAYQALGWTTLRRGRTAVRLTSLDEHAM